MAGPELRARFGSAARGRFLLNGSAAAYIDAQLVENSLAFATTVFTNVFNWINDTQIDFPAIA